MANQEDLQRITDSTLREMAAVIESHNRNYQDPEEAALRDEVEKMKKEIEMVDKTIKVREKSNEQLKIKLEKVQRSYNKVVKPREQKLKTLKTTTIRSIKTMETVETFHRAAMEKWGKKKAKFNMIIEKMNEYIAIMHSKLDRHGIAHDYYMTESDEDESDESEDFDLTGQGQYESDTQFEDDETDGEDEPENRFEYQPSPYHHRNTGNEQVNVEEPQQSRSDVNENEEASSNTGTENMILEANEPVEPHYCNINDTNPQEQSCYDDLIETQDGKIQQESSTTNIVAENSVLEDDDPQADHCSIVAGNPHETNWCDMIDAEDLETCQQSQLNELDHKNNSVSDPRCKNEDEKSQEASNTEAENSIFELDEPVETHNCNYVAANTHEEDCNEHSDSASSSKTDVEHIQEDASISNTDQPFKSENQISKLDSFVHCYGKVKQEVKKPKKKQQKPKRK